MAPCTRQASNSALSSIRSPTGRPRLPDSSPEARLDPVSLRLRTTMMAQQQEQCPSCGHSVPAGNMLMHSSFCRAASPHSRGTNSSSSTNGSPQAATTPPMPPQQHQSPVIASSPARITSSIEDSMAEQHEEEEQDSDLMIVSPPGGAVPSSSNRRRVGPRRRLGLGPASASGEDGDVVDLTQTPGNSQAVDAFAFSSPAVVVVDSQESLTAAAATAEAAACEGQPKDDGAGAEEGDVEIQCGTCTYANPAHVDLCQMCMAPLSGGGGGGGAGAMQGVGGQAAGEEEEELPPGACWYVFFN